MAIICSIDFETKSALDLTEVGVYRYAESAEIMCAAYSIYEEGKFDREDVKCWRAWKGEPLPADLRDAMLNSAVKKCAWNAQFERLITQACVKGVVTSLEDWYCTAARARASAYPGKLELCAKALGIDVQKDLAGAKVMKKLASGEAGTEAEYERMMQYCVQDVVVEATIGMVVRDLTAEEWQDYWVCERMNDRGIPVDVELARAAQKYAEVEAEEIKRELADVTDGKITSPKQFKRIKDWLTEHAPELMETLTDEETGKVSLDRSARTAIFEGDLKLPERVEAMLHLIDDAGRASTAKFAAIENRASDDDRLRGAYLFNGAGQTGRFSAMGFQPHNLVRDKLENGAAVVDAILGGQSAEDVIALSGQNMLTTLARTLRPTIVAPEPHTLVWADYSSVEARVLPWLSESPAAEPLLQLFREGQDVYIHAAAGIYKVPATKVDKAQRQMGKIAVLALGYQGGKNAFRKMARAYGLKIDDDTAELIKVAWRNANPWAGRFWQALETAAIKAVTHPGEVTEAGRMKYLMHGDMLYGLLPCGRLLAYPEASVDVIETKFGQRAVLTALKASMHPKKGEFKWPRVALYGGLLAENCLAADTEVLTIEGWRPLTAVGALPVWDGEAFVQHDGLAYKGARAVGTLDGVRMTAEHKVLTEEGWLHAEAVQGHRRAAVRIPDSYDMRRFSRRQASMEDALRLRRTASTRRYGVDAGARAFLRLPQTGNAGRREADARDVVASSICRLVFDAREMLARVASSVAQLRWPGHQGVQAVAYLRGVLGRHGVDVPRWAFAGAGQQRAELFTPQLSLGYPRGAGEQPAHEHVGRDALGQHDHRAGGASLGYWCDDTAVSNGAGVAHRTVVHEAVYDLLNCGPRNRFVVRGASGPFIVHNCTQGFAASLLRAAARDLDAAGWPVVMHTHDELVLEVEDDEVPDAEAALEEAMVTAKYPGLPLAVEVQHGYIYSK